VTRRPKLIVTLTIKKVDCVHVTNNQRSYTINRAKVALIATEVARRLGVNHYEICLRFVSPKAMRSLNRQYRDKDKSTDVLSFPQYVWKRPLKVKTQPPPSRPILNPLPLGDVVISTSDAAENARDSGHEIGKEVCFLIIHGILHLVGHDHMKPSEKKRMFSEQRKLMRLFSATKTRPAAWKGCMTAKRKSKP
jgi:probable rRNA maturation factor